MKRGFGTGVGRVALVVALVGSIVAWRTPDTAAQPAPRPLCVAGETPNQRIEAIIAILIGYQTLADVLAPGLTVDPSDPSGNTLYELCPGVAVLNHFDKGYLPPLLGLLSIDIWEHALKGMSLTEIGRMQGVAREAIVEALATGYGAALDQAVAAGEINATQRQRLADRILPNFGWLVDYSFGDAVAGGDVTGDHAGTATIDALPGSTGQERSENAIRLLVGLPVAGLDLNDPVAIATAHGGVWKALGAAALAAVVPDGSLSPEEVYAEYLAGKSLLDIHAEHGGDPATLTETLLAALDAALDAAVESGEMTPEERAEAEPVLAAALMGATKHHLGDPIPNDFVGGNPLTESPAPSSGGAAATCQGVPATHTAVGAGPINGSAWGDVIVGTSGNDIIDGGGGVDLICALQGNDTIEGGQGRDTIWAGAGNDLVFGESSGVVVTGGGDTIWGEAGDDTILGQVGDDELHGQNGNDEIEGGDGGDDLFGGDGNDDLDGGSGSDTCDGGPGVDTFSQC